MYPLQNTYFYVYVFYFGVCTVWVDYLRFLVQLCQPGLTWKASHLLSCTHWNSQTLKTVSQTSKNVGSAPQFLSINSDRFKHVSDVTLHSRTPWSPPPPRPFNSRTLLPLTFPISQHSWAVPHQSKGQFIGLMLQWVQTGLWDRMFGWYLALLRQTSHQNMISERGEGTVFLTYFTASKPC